MQNFNTNTGKKAKRISKKLATWVLLIAMLIQMLSLTCMATASAVSPFLGGSSGGNILNGFGKFDSDETIAQLKKDFLGSINKDLIQKIEDYSLTGEVGVILTFSEDSVVNSYKRSSVYSKMSFDEYRESSAAKKLVSRLERNRGGVLSALESAGLISKVEHTYSNIMDGAFVRTTYEQLEAICDFEGVERVTLSNTYLPAVAVDNPVDVYDTGIFNSGSVSFTGKGTVVAILDTGCDYTHSAFTTHQVVSPKHGRDYIAEKLPELIAYSYDPSLEAREVYYGNITGGKIVYGYDYADKDPDVMPLSNSHGTHVAGIIGGKDDTITGVAIDTQLAIMKVFSDYDVGAEDGDILAALEDSVKLGVDVINMSLGSSCGFTREADDDYKNSVYDSIEAVGISLVVATSNDYSSGYGADDGNTNKTHNPDSATVGSPSTYDAAFSVASINGNKDKYLFANGDREVFFNEAFNQSSKPYDFFDMLGVTPENPHAEFEYVTIPGLGYAINYSGLNLEGKIALVRRGDITFEEKVQFAYEAGAAAIIIYNNVFGDIIMTVGNDLKIPVVSIGRDDGDAMAQHATGVVEFDYNNVAGPFMSDFSSWGPNPDLTLKPEITAHGGNILSAIVGGEYEEMSGTSMAAPNMAGIVVLIRQYVIEKYKDLPTPAVRDLVNQLCMSTATIAMDKKGNPYSPRKQGAGIADIAKSTTTPAYLYVDGIGKTKLELGDDPTRTGVYEMTINLKNISDQSVSYRIGNIAMTESVSTSDPEYVAEMAYLLSNTAEYSVLEGGSLENGIVTVAPGQTAKVKAVIKLSAQDKSYLNQTFKNGMYVEGYLTFDNVAEGGIDLNAPFLAFYGDWGEAPIFDLDYYEVETEAHNNAIDDDDKIKADYYPTTPTGTYYYDYILPLGSYVYDMDESEYTPIPATAEHAAISYYADAISGIYGVFAGLLRGAKEMAISIVDTSTGKVVWADTQYNCYKAHFNGSAYPHVSNFNLPMADAKTGEVFGNNNTRYEVTMTAKLDWNGENRNSSDTYTFSFYIDYEAPSVVDATFRTEYDKGREENRYYADIMVYDNHYAMSIRPILVYQLPDDDGEMKNTYSSLIENPIPIYQENRGEVTKVTLEITDYIDIITDSAMPEGLTVYIDDYAMNSGVAYIPFEGLEGDGLEFLEDEIDLDINETADLASLLVYKDTTNPAEAVYLRALTWTSSDESVVAVNDGKIEALKTGSVTISAVGSTWGGAKTIKVNVSETEADDPNSADNVQIESLEFTSYDTLFAFNSDIDYSEIGLTGSVNYFGGNNSISFYPSEKVKLNYDLEPWNMAKDRYTLKWSSSNPKVATVDENGVVTAEEEGVARITLNITIDGKQSLLAARCAVTVKSEFIIENRTLVAYKGKGGDVVIPDDEGIMTIGAFAFCHYNLDNEKEVEKDENGYYDIDLKKEPLGNNTVTSIVIPEGVETIEKYAFYNCKLLSDVTFPESCKTINQYAFAKCDVLENANFENVNIILDYAFYQCQSLTCVELGGVDLSGVYAIGDYAFSGTRFDSVKLTTLSRIGVGIFAECTKLKNVELGKRTRVTEKMFEGTPVESIVIYSDMVDDGAFRNCSNLKTVEFKNDLTYVGVEAFSGCTKLEEVVFEGICEQIADFAFYDCSALESFLLPDCEIAIGSGAFGSSAIKDVKFGKNTFITAGGIGMFDSVNDISVDVSESDYYKLVGDIIYSKDGSRLVLLLPTSTAASITVPKEVTEIADGAFSSNRYLKSVSFESGSLLNSIGSGAFAYSGIVSVALPDREISIGDSAFLETVALQTINLNKVKSVGDFAFQGSGLSSAELTLNNVEIGGAAFYGALYLRDVKLGKGASVGAYAFAATPVRSVELLGDGVTVDEGAFSVCTSLTSFTFENVTGRLGDFAFYACSALKSVNAPGITEIGEGCFADCSGLETLSAANLEVIGDYAFGPYSEESERGSGIESVYAPKLRAVGEYAFYACYDLASIDLSGVTEIGTTAFALCSSLTSVELSEELEVLEDLTFYGCTALADIDVSGIVRFGIAALYGVQLPAELVLTKAEYIAEQAFVEDESIGNYIESVEAPNLIYAGDQAFAGCLKLESVYAPKLEEIGIGAFAYTAIVEFEVFDSLKTVGFSLFEGSESFAAFFTTVNGEKVYDKEYDNVMIKDGVLYTVTPVGYILVSYPLAKEGTEFTVADGTARIEYCAALGNKYLEKVILPQSLRYIGNHSFYMCDNLNTVVFKSYYAPVLEGTMTGEQIDIKPDTIENFPGFDKLYKYEYYYRFSDVVAAPYYYSTFKGIVASKEATGLTYVLPTNNSGYDSIIYKAFFTPSETENSGMAMGPYAIAFIDAVKRLPEVVDRFDKALIDAAINAYNALDGKTDEMAYVDDAFVAKFNQARSEYNISVTEDKIAHLFDMDNSKYSFDIVKDARASYLALTEAERALVKNASVLDVKIADLAAAMGKTPDFSLSYEDHFPKEPDAPTEEPQPNGGLKAWQIVLIVCASVVGAALVAGGAVFTVIFLKKKKALTSVDEAEEGAPADAAAEDGSAEESATNEDTAEDGSAEESAESADETSDMDVKEDKND